MLPKHFPPTTRPTQQSCPHAAPLRRQRPSRHCLHAQARPRPAPKPLKPPETVDVATGDATADPLASSGGTVSVAPTFSRLGSCFMKACGFAANSARPARASTPGSRDWVAATAISLSD
ncbi:hypothetical protein [Burkholderia gladioli]|uniref:hypothetical protein n=1 Tax=Burkholderia gladioli TaxID=28095 RepID=UPI003C7CB3F7